MSILIKKYKRKKILKLADSVKFSTAPIQNNI